MDTKKELLRIVSIYSLSPYVRKALGGKQPSIVEDKLDLLNDMLSVMLYDNIIQNISPKIVKNVPDQWKEISTDLIKSVVITVVSSYFAGTLSFKSLAPIILCIIVYHIIVRPMLLKRVNNRSRLDALEDIVLLSVNNHDINDTIAKVVSFGIYDAYTSVKSSMENKMIS